jgi:uncharacterized Fe-S cluster protein YjdI
MTRRTYPGTDIQVTFDADLCIHATECVRGLPAVFDRDRRPWVMTDHAPADEVSRVVERCPTGALQYERRDQYDHEGYARRERTVGGPRRPPRPSRGRHP